MGDLIGHSIAKALGGRKASSGWIARCPAHDDRKPSLSIGETKDGKILVHCHAGCDQDHVIAAHFDQIVAGSEACERRCTP
jgi:putative DNA primase/helicase